jgi:nucleoside-diphosphate-sugar epimerase
MNRKRIFITGASGCIGHYIADALIRETDHELFLLLRDPGKLRFDYQMRPGIKILQGDMRSIAQYADLLKEMDTAILTATSWGGEQEAYEINVQRTEELIDLLDPTVCEQIIYFSTASILDQQNQPLAVAGQVQGQDYIRSKYLGFQKLQQSAMFGKMTVLFPTIVFGGNERFPKSPLTAGLGDVMRWVPLARFFKADASFHFIHGRDIAAVVQHFVDAPPQVGEPRQFVLGNDRLTVDGLLRELCAYFNKRMYFQVSLTEAWVNFFIKVFRIQIGEWERFALHHRHFTHQNVVNPASFGREAFYPTLSSILQVCGIVPKR